MQLGDAPAGRHGRVGQVDPEVCVVADPGAGRPQRGLRGLDLAVELGAQLAGRHLRVGLALVHHDLRLALVEIVGARVAAAAGQLGLGLHALPPLGADRLLGGAHGPGGRGLLFLQVL
jgi:hypothetical protein